MISAADSLQAADSPGPCQMKDGSGHAAHSVASDAAAWLGNVSSSVLIVFVNKLLMDPRTGYKFQFGEFSCFQTACTPSRAAGLHLTLAVPPFPPSRRRSNDALRTPLLVSCSLRQHNPATRAHKQSTGALER